MSLLKEGIRKAIPTLLALGTIATAGCTKDGMLGEAKLLDCDKDSKSSSTTFFLENNGWAGINIDGNDNKHFVVTVTFSAAGPVERTIFDRSKSFTISGKRSSKENGTDVTIQVNCNK